MKLCIPRLPRFRLRPRQCGCRAGVLCLGLGWICAALAMAQAPAQPVRGASDVTGGRADWARLKFDTGGPDWDRHEYADREAIARLRADTSMNFNPEVQAAALDRLEEMIRHPFIFSYGLHRRPLPERQRENLREYLKRGGFLLIEECANREVTPDPLREFFASERFFLELLPGSKIVLLDRDHPIFHCMYEMKEGLPFTRSSSYEYSKKSDGLAAVMFEGRMVALISSACLHCDLSSKTKTAKRGLVVGGERRLEGDWGLEV